MPYLVGFTKCICSVCVVQQPCFGLDMTIGTRRTILFMVASHKSVYDVSMFIRCCWNDRIYGFPQSVCLQVYH